MVTAQTEDGSLDAHGFRSLVEVIATLRGPDGCPWDREQTHRSIAKNMIEEAYEAVHEIEQDNAAALQEELGDVLLQVLLHAQIAADANEFTIDDVIAGIHAKLVRRHPHVFGDESAGDAAEVLAKWDRIKRAEKVGQGAGLLDDVPDGLPALMLAQKISRKAIGAGFDFDSLEGVWDKVHEELTELAETEPGSSEAADELGDVLFSVVNLAHKQGIDAETALRSTCDKFRRRWADMEREAEDAGREVSEYPVAEMEVMWRRAKERERS